MVIISKGGFEPTHSSMVSRIGNWLPIGRFRCVAVMMERGGGAHGEWPDVFGVQADGTSYLIECKISRSDFQADQKKVWRQKPKEALGKYRYYAAPVGLLNREDIPDGWGLLEVSKRMVCIAKESKPFKQNETGLRKEIAMLARAVRDVKCGVLIVPNESQEAHRNED